MVARQAIRYGLVLLLLSGCATTQFKYGVTLHPEHFDSTDSDMENPMLTIRAEQRFGKVYVDGQHTSSAKRRESNYGTNYLSILGCLNCKPECN